MTPKFTSLIFCFIIPLISTGQNLVVANPGMNVLYIGVDNEIQFASKTIPYKNLSLKPQRGEIVNYHGKLYYRYCQNNPGLLAIYAYNRLSRKIVDSALFRLKRIPDPIIKLVASNMQEGVYVGNDLAGDFVGLVGFCCGDFEAAVKIIGFTITVTNQNSTQKDFYFNGPSVSSDDKKQIASFDKNSSLKVHRVIVNVGCDTTARQLTQEFKLQ